MTEMEEQAGHYSFKNGFGEVWVFEHEAAENRGIIKGSDVDWREYPVIGGQAFDLALNSNEKSWLRAVWEEATGHLGDSGVYSGRDIEFKIDKQGCWLTEDFCPVCLRQKREFDRHHCIWSADGGTEDYFNMLRVCRTCHAILTYGSVEDRVPRDLAAFYHQIMYFGLEFFPRNNLRKNRYKDRSFLEMNPKWKHIVQRYDSLGKAEQNVEDSFIKEMAKLRYQYYRDVGLGKWSWTDRERLIHG